MTWDNIPVVTSHFPSLILLFLVAKENQTEKGFQNKTQCSETKIIKRPKRCIWWLANSLTSPGRSVHNTIDNNKWALIKSIAEKQKMKKILKICITYPN